MIPDNRRIILIGEDIEEASSDEKAAQQERVQDAIDVVDIVPTPFGDFAGELGSRLQDDIDVIGRLNPRRTGAVIFEVQPNISESGSVSYFEIGDVRQAANMMIYMGTPSREFSIQGRFVSRTENEAYANWRYVQLLRSWRMPEKRGGGVNLKTPSRLKLSGFGDWFNNIHVRITSLNIEMPDTTDYIRTFNGKDVPIVWPVTVTLKETRSIEALRRFRIQEFRDGVLDAW